MKRCPYDVLFILVTIIVQLAVVMSHVCVLKRRPDQSRGNILRWSLPYAEICRCHAVVASFSSFATCPAVADVEQEYDLLFVDIDDPRQLNMPRNRQKNIVDELLDRIEYCDVDECVTDANNCSVNALCIDTIGSFMCECDTGYSGDGMSCTDVDECATDIDTCAVDAMCTNTIGSFMCQCNTGYAGDGMTCTDVDECATDIDTCAVNAICSNTIGSFQCECNTGYSGDGMTCTDVDECSTNPCHIKAACSNTEGSFTCRCNIGYYGDGMTCALLKDCQEIAAKGFHQSGSYIITPSDGLGSVAVYCDMESNGGGWTVFQKHFDGSVNFDRVWNDYEQGFGSVGGEYWMGLRNIRRLVSEAGTSWILRIDLEAFDGDTAYAEYDSFTIDDAQANYKWSFGTYEGNAGDALGELHQLSTTDTVHNGMEFSTSDRDNDPSGINCADRNDGGFWFSKCFIANLNGLYFGSGQLQSKPANAGILWFSWKGDVSMKRAEMKIKRQ